MNKNEFLAFSLPYDVKAIDKFECIWTIHAYKDALDGFKDNEHLSYENFIKEEVHRLILHPLPDLTKQIEHKGEKIIPMVDIFLDNVKEVKGKYIIFKNGYSTTIIELKFKQVQKLIEWHFDIAGLIEKGEAIDVNTLEVNPYK